MSEATVIGIKNVADLMYHIWTSKRGWESFPLELPSGGKYIQPRSPEIPPGTVIAGQVDGIELVRSPIEANGVTQYEAPRLNYFPVKLTMPCNDRQSAGCGMWYSNIKIGEQPPELFAPGGGATLP